MSAPHLRRCLTLALAGTCVLAHAQDGPPVLVCENGDINRCVSIQASELPGEAPNPADMATVDVLLGHQSYIEPTNATTGYPVDSTGLAMQGSGLVPTDAELDAFLNGLPTAPVEPSQAWLEWERVDVPDDPTVRLPGRCAQTPQQARGRFSMAARDANINALIATYHWRGKSERQADPIIERLQRAAVEGQWETSVVGMWTGATDIRDQVPEHWRWAGIVDNLHLAMRQTEGCWFVEFSSDPGDSIVIAADKIPTAPTVTEAGPEPTIDPDNPDILVF